MRSYPSLRRHKARNLGVVTLCGHDHYLGPWPAHLKEPPAEVQRAYDRIIAEWLAAGRRPLHQQPDKQQATSGTVAAAFTAGASNPAATPLEIAGPAGLTVGELIVAFWAHAEKHYRRPDSTPTSELTDYRLSLRPLADLYETLPVAQFSPLKLKAVRQRMIEADLSRGVINQRVARIVRMFGWGVSEELVPETVHRALGTVQAIQKGRSDARETEKVKPVADEVVAKTLPFLTAQVSAMVQVQRLTGMRGGEVCDMRPRDIDRSGPVWTYRPQSHKTSHKGKERVIALGPNAQAVLLPFLEGRDPDAHLFSPREAMEALWASKRKERKTKVQPSQRCRKKARPKKRFGTRYNRHNYCQSVAAACVKAGVEHWHPHQLRHTHATEVRKLYGLEGAQVALGHSQANVTQVYAERDLALLLTIAQKIG